jgi:hypothetical protein
MTAQTKDTLLAPSRTFRNHDKDARALFPAAYVLAVRQEGRWELDSTKYKAPTVKLVY